MRLRILNAWLRYAVRPVLGRARSPERQARAFDRIGPRLFRGPPFICHLTERAGDLRLHWISVGRPDPRRVILYLHGGAFIVGSGVAYRGLLGRIAKLTGLRVCAPDYRLLQDAPFPAAFDDAVGAWDALLAKGYRPSDIVLGGDSARGRSDAGAAGAALRTRHPSRGVFCDVAVDGYDAVRRQFAVT